MRLSNGFNCTIENHMAVVALNYFAYNFIKIHTTLRTSPATAAGITTRLFGVSGLVALLIESESRKAARAALAPHRGFLLVGFAAAATYRGRLLSHPE